MVTLTINGNTITASPDRTILQVCNDQKLDTIPTLCYDEKMKPFGSCFLCVVEIEGQAKLFTACSTKVAEGMKIQTRSERVRKARKTCLELLLSDHYADCFGPCRLNCPADVDIQGYMSLIHLGKFKEAVALIKEKNPLPLVCGRVCTRKCELNCRRAIVDEPVGIDFLKRYAADQDMIGEMWKPETKADNGTRVAIIGGGPAGLTSAYYLAIEGYRPTIFESLPELGGMLRYGIPEYRLPKEVLDKEIGWITSFGVEVKTNISLGKDFTIDDLFAQGFKSVFVALGAQVGKPMQVENEYVPGVLTGVDFLRQVQLKTNPPVGGRVVVVGGGNTAVDAARTSLRLGAKEVILLYRRTRSEMPANIVEIEAAEHEGVKMELLAAPVRINIEGDRLASVECIRMELGEPDASGRRRPVPMKGSEYSLTCDWVISAIGQDTNLTGVDGDEKIKVTKWKTLSAKDGTFDTDRPGVFAGGDVVTGPADAIDAIAAGRMAARAIDKYIGTGVIEPLTQRFESKRDNFHKLTAADIPVTERSEQHKLSEIPALERILGFREVESGYDDQTAITESFRCAECGCDVGLACRLQDYCTEYGVEQKRFVGAFNKYKVDTRHPYIKIDSNKCIRCGRCVNTCSEVLNISALGFVNRGFRTIVKPAMEKALQETNCVSCGNCIDVCPTGALVEKMPFRRSGPWKMEAVYNVCNYCSVGCNITLQVKTPDLFYVMGAPPDTKPNNGELCMWGRFGYQHYLDGSRALKPMVRKEGALVPATWEEAFAEIKNGVQRIRDAHSPDAFIVSASPKLTNEELYLAGRFARTALGTNNILSFHRAVNEADYHALDNMLGITSSTVTMEDVENADLYIVVGGNPTVETPVIGWRMKRRIKNGTPSIVINSAQIDLTRYATVWADARRGTATQLLNGVIAELIRRGAVDQKFIVINTENFGQFKEAAAKYHRTEVASITGVAPETIERIAEILADPSKKIVAYYHIESRMDRATGDLAALASLLTIIGKISGNGSGLALLTGQCNNTGMQTSGFDASLLPGGYSIKNSDAMKKTSGKWNADLQKMIDVSGSNIGRKLRSDTIRSAFVLGENPAAAPEHNGLINNLEFLVVADMFLTETAQAADVFLPLSGYLETDGHLTNWCGMEQRTNPIGEPLNGYRTADIIACLAELAGQKIEFGSIEEVTDELKGFGINRGNAEKIRLGYFADQISESSPFVPKVLEIDARMLARSKAVKG
ncbi:MAG: molybdopterin-dependent oxidoreductase [Ignavibacteriales bacterium]|nr:molybdopterin-dependent oxidoreductase [Ignavibacteriales bacterium]